MTEHDLQSAAEKLEALHSAYAASLDAKLTDIEALVDRLLNADALKIDDSLLEELGAKAHKLSGSAGTFGFSRVSKVAKKMELFCQALGAGQTSLTNDDRQQMSKLMASLRQGRDQPQALSYRGEIPESDAARPEESRSSDMRNILLIEDDPEQFNHLTIGIGAFGYAIKVIANVDNIEAGIAAYQPAAIILDLQFEQGRTAAAKTIQKIRANSGITCPIIVLTVHGDFKARLAAVRACSDHFLTKPVTLDKLVQLLDRLIAPAEMQPERVMIIDDDPDICEYVKTCLQATGMIVETLADVTLALEKIQEFRPELILVDLHMPECNGKELAAVIRQIPEHSGIPIVFLSSEKDTDAQFDAMSVGADDFLTKPIEPRYLAPAVRLRVERFRVLHDMMARDSLTGLYNHATTKQLLETELHRAHRQGSEISFAMLDIDHFKAVNDRYGHLTGDAVIKLLAGILTHRLRNGDIVGRLGGEEFGVVLPNTALDQAHTVMEAVRTGFEEISQSIAGSDEPVTLSCGIASFPAYDSVDELSQAADLALYDAKSKGRNVTVLASSPAPRQLRSSAAS